MHAVRSLLVLAVSLSALGCITPQGSKGTEVLHNSMIPSNAPQMVGAFDFELLGPVEGTGCVATMDSTT